MPKFVVQIGGENFRIRVVRRNWFRDRYHWVNTGLSTTRFVEAETATEAIERVLEVVRKELTEMGRITEDSTLELESVREDDEAFDLYAPGKGFTFSIDE
jgi:selenophosphate synthetase-related protein